MIEADLPTSNAVARAALYGGTVLKLASDNQFVRFLVCRSAFPDEWRVTARWWFDGKLKSAKHRKVGTGTAMTDGGVVRTRALTQVELLLA